MNKDYTDCPECAELISKTARACACGWKAKKQNKSVGMKRCSFKSGDIQCPKWATIDDATCRYHIDWWDNPVAAARSLNLILSGEIGRDRNWREDALVEFQHKHPEFKIIPASKDEVKDHVAVTKKYIGKSSSLPYDKNKVVA